MPAIQDAKLEQIFRAESEERLARLDSGLLALEQDPADRARLEELFREVHSLKGAARMLGLTAVETTTHSLESLLNAARRAETAFDAAGMEALDAGLRKLRQQIEAVLAPAPPAAEAGPAAAPAAAAPAFHIETVRVETARLDDLLALTGELGVLRGRIRHRQILVGLLLDEWALLERSQRELGGAPAGPLARRLEAQAARIERLGGLLRSARDSLHEDRARFETILDSLQERVQGMRLLPLATVFNLFPRMVRDLGREQGKEVELQLEGADITLDKRILEEIKDPLMHLLRNAVGHGIEPPAERLDRGKPGTGRIRLAAARAGDHVTIAVEDDGRGLDLEAIRRTAMQRGGYDPETLAGLPASQLQQLVFAPGFSTATDVTELAGRGIGLDVVRANVERLKGTLRLESAPGRGTTIALRLPLSLATLRLLVVAAGGHSFGLPLEAVHALRRLAPAARYSLEGRAAMDFEGQPLLLAELAELLELPPTEPARDAAGKVVCIVLQVEGQRLGLQVDDILAEEEVVPRPLGPPLKRLRNVSSLATLTNGLICPVLNPADLLFSALRRGAAGPAPVAAGSRPPSILLVEDSALVRAMEKRIIEDAGYDVVAAVDGADALEKLGSRPFAAVVSDIQMPNLDGLALTARLRQEAAWRDLPVILVSSLDDEADRRRGLEVGANAYIPKPTFDQRVLVDTLKRLIGP